MQVGGTQQDTFVVQRLVRALRARREGLQRWQPILDDALRMVLGIERKAYGSTRGRRIAELQRSCRDLEEVCFSRHAFEVTSQVVHVARATTPASIV
jgi:hypothetical protein